MDKDISEYLASVNDPRVEGRCDHLLSDILLIAICTYLVGGSDYQDMVLFGKERGQSLEGLLVLPNGVPSHDTFSRVFSLLDSDSLEKCLANYGKDILAILSEKQIAIDGKKLRGVSPTTRGNDGLYILNTWVCENGHHTDTRWVSLNTTNSKGLLIEADNTIGFNALRNSVEDFDCQESDADYQWRNMSPQEIANKDYEAAKDVLHKQTHESDITPRNFVEVCVDMKQYGVAGYNSWGARPEPEYSIFANREYN